ncbi:MAG: HAD hydrolase-like protein [Muribaculaceae bacterium]|nr:HAD hydrolase-like protein [Muribaculaceae bacterium]
MPGKIIPAETLLAFDLDDTLLHETAYIRGVFDAIREEFPHLPEPCFYDLKLPYVVMEKWADGNTGILNSMIRIYRTGEGVAPFLTPVPDLLRQLRRQGYLLTLITDGFSIRQRAKIRLLGIEDLFSEIWISEERKADKLSGKPFAEIPRMFQNLSRFIYIGDNPAKDFHPAHRYGWDTIMLEATAENIHPQNTGTPARRTIATLSELKNLSTYKEGED